MTLRAFLVAIIILATGPAAAADEARPIGALEVLAPLTAASWVAAFPDSDGATDTQRFEWMYGGKFLRNTHQVRDGSGRVVYEGETVYAWDWSAERVVWWYWNTTGGHVVGTMDPEDGALVFEGVNHGPDGQTPAVKGEIRMVEGGWTATQLFLRDGSWVPQTTLEYRRAGEERAEEVGEPEER